MKHYLAALILVASLLSCTREETVPVQSQTPDKVTVQPCGEFVTGEARVYLSEDLTAMLESAAESGSLITKSQDMNLALDELGITQMSRLFPHAGEYEERTRREGLHRWYIVKYSEDVAMTKAQVSLEQVEGVEYFEPVRNVRINDFNDFSSDLWGLYNRSYPGYDINVKKVWDEYTTGSADVIVAVVDEGVDLDHEDLADNCLASGHYNAVNENNYIIPGDHGTHVAGTIAAVSNNGKGIVGIAGGDKAKGKPGVKIMSCQMFVNLADGTSVSSASSSSASIKHGADHGAVISQNSWGYNPDSNGDGKLSSEEIERAMKTTINRSDKAAVDYFVKYAGCDNNGNQLPNSPMKGGVVIFAAGNDGIGMGAPAEYEGVIAVGAISRDGTKASFSNYGDWVDICAPGVGILSCAIDDSYLTMGGTSMACPHVSGVAALLVSHFGGQGFTNEMLKEKLLNSANTSIVSSAYKIGGLLDAYGAFAYGNDKAPAAVQISDLTASGNKIDVTCVVPADEDGKAAYGLLAVYGTDKSKVEAATPSKLDGVGSTAYAPEAPAGESVIFPIRGLEFEKQYYVKVFAYSYGRNYSDASSVEGIKTTSNNPPEITYVLPEGKENLNILPSETVRIAIEIIEPDDHAFTYSHTKGSDAETFETTPDGKWRLTINGGKADMGTYTAKFVAEDEYGCEGYLDLVYTIKENSAPVKLKDIDNVLLTSKGKEFVIDMSEYATDPDGEQLKYDVSTSDSKIVHLNAKGNTITGTALGYGLVDAKIIAKDARGETATFEFKIQVKDPSTPLSVYPNPVTDYLNVGTLDKAETTIRIYSSTGKLVHDETSQVSGMEPARIDMRDCAPGNYSLQVTFGGKEYKQNIVKL